MTAKNLTGGCQCGAVRYEWVEKPAYSSVCYCRMCQKASGQPFMGFTGGKIEHLQLDARRALVLPLVEHGAARFLQGLRHAADLRVRR